MKRLDWYIVALIFVTAIIFCLPTLRYPIVGDVTFYAENAAVLHHFRVYGRMTPEGYLFETNVPPLFAMATAVVMFLVRNPASAVRVSGILFFALTSSAVYLASRKLGFKRGASSIITALTTFNPLYFYYCVVIGGTESISTVLLVLSFLLFMKRKDTVISYTLLGLCMGLYTMTRITSAFIIAPFALYLVYEAVTHKHYRILRVWAVVLSGIFGTLWLIRTWYLTAAAPASIYTEAYVAGNLSVQGFLTMLAGLVFVSSPLLFLFAAPFAAYQAVHYVKARDELPWKLLVISFVLFCIVLATFTPTSLIVRARQLVPYVPLVTVMAVAGFLTIVRKPKLQQGALVAIAGILVFGCGWLNYGYLKDATDQFYPLPRIYQQMSLHRAQAISHINEASADGAVVIGLLDQSSVAVNINRMMQQYFNPGITYLILPDDRDLSSQETVVQYGVSKLRDKRLYVLTEYDTSTTIAHLNQHLSEYSLSEQYQNPTETVYEIQWT